MSKVISLKLNYEEEVKVNRLLEEGYTSSKILRKALGIYLNQQKENKVNHNSKKGILWIRM